MKHIFKSILLILSASFVLVLASCDNTAAESTNIDSKVAQVTTEAADGEPPYRFFYKKLYEFYTMDNLYDGSMSEFDSSVISDYEFIGVVAGMESSDSVPDKELVSTFIKEGTPVLYNKETESFIFWQQEDNYWISLIKVIDEGV